jgi:hypothetical protein
MAKTAPGFPAIVVDSHDYFPTQEGLQWKYVTKGAKRSQAKLVTILKQFLFDGNELIAIEEKPIGDESLIRFYLKKEAGFVGIGSIPAIPLLEKVMPFVWIPRRIEPGYLIEQFNKANVDAGRDFDGDGKNESIDMKASLTVGDEESMTVPAGTYKATRIDYKLTMEVHLTRTDERKTFSQHVTQWLAKGIGVVKRVDEGPGLGFQKWPPAIRKTSEELQGLKVLQRS